MCFGKKTVVEKEQMHNSCPISFPTGPACLVELEKLYLMISKEQLE